MKHDSQFTQRVNRRLSGLNASAERRDRIRSAIYAHAQPEEVLPVKRKLTAAPVFALILVLLMASLAIADSLNLFNFFGRKDERYASVAPHAALTVSETARIEHPHLGKVTASIDSAYFDGLSLSLAYRIDHPCHVEEYTPTTEEVAAMQPDEPVIIALVGSEPGLAIYEAYNAAVSNGTPFGYRQYTVYPSDHTITDDGIDIPPSSAISDYDESGAYCEMREFATPVPAGLCSRDVLNVSITMYQQETAVWFDGQHCYISYDRSEVGRMDASVPLTKDAVQTMKGSGEINGVKCSAEARVSQMAASITVHCGAPLSSFLAAAPEGTDTHDSWAEVIAMDENGSRFRQQEGFGVDERSSFTLSFDGTGSVPETLNLYVYTAWEGMDEPDLAAMDSITLRPVP